MRIEILHIDDCPNWRDAGRRVSRAVTDLGIAGATVEFTRIASPAQAADRPFSGSPTILIDGVDPFPTNGTTAELACRIYRVDGRFAGIPSAEQIRSAITDAAASD
jgi:hypothetical protein